MDDDQIDEMVAALLNHADRDLWKSIYSDAPDDPDADEKRDRLREIARRHMEAA